MSAHYNLGWFSGARMYHVTYDAKANLIRSWLSGFMTIENVAAYAAEVEPTIRRAAASTKGYLILIDLSGCPIQSQTVLAAFQEHVANMPRARRCAVVTGSSMIRMQVKRTLQGPAMKMFEDDRAAMMWLKYGSETATG